MKSKTILIAYQDDLWARSLSTFFHGMGYRVEMVRVLSEMIRKVRNGNIHVILLDDEVEGVKAWDLVSLLKKINLRGSGDCDFVGGVFEFSETSSWEQAYFIRR